MKIDVTPDELRCHLAEQIEFLKLSTHSYDNGFQSESKRLAVTARVLLHDTASSTSLLNMLSMKTIKFYDTSAPHDESNLMSHSSLTQMGMRKGKAHVLPTLDGGPFQRHINFDPWWNGIVFVDKDKNEFSRKDIVLSLANKEGGAHVDKNLDDAYVNLRKFNSLGWADISPDGKETPGEDQVPAAMRQIAHEIVKTLDPNYRCELKDKETYEVFFLGGMLHEGASPPPVPQHNLPKNRPLINGKKIGRNDQCPCGSGKKYKKCCIQ